MAIDDHAVTHMMQQPWARRLLLLIAVMQKEEADALIAYLEIVNASRAKDITFSNRT